MSRKSARDGRSGSIVAAGVAFPANNCRFAGDALLPPGSRRQIYLGTPATTWYCLLRLPAVVTLLWKPLPSDCGLSFMKPSVLSPWASPDDFICLTTGRREPVCCREGPMVAKFNSMEVCPSHVVFWVHNVRQPPNRLAGCLDQVLRFYQLLLDGPTAGSILNRGAHSTGRVVIEDSACYRFFFASV